MRSFPEDSSQTFKVGDPIILSADSNEGNRIKIAGSDPATDRALVGFAAAPASGTAGTKIPVWLATGDAEFIVHACGAAAADTTLDNDNISVEFGIIADATNEIWRLDDSETTAKVFRVLELYDTHGDTNGRYIVHVIAPERLYHD
jgi:hypothetical protein